jgi:hypothetical protein
MVQSCPLAKDDLDRYLAFREVKAADLLFSECLRRFENTSKRSAFSSMFGKNVVITKAAPKVVATTATTASKPQAVQKSISSYLYDSFLVDNMKKRDRAAVSAAKAATKVEKKKEIS